MPDPAKPPTPASLPSAPPGPVIKPPRSRWAVRIGVAVAALGVLGFLFLRSVRSARSEAYTFPREALAGWAPALVEAETSMDPVLGVHVNAEIIRPLFNQVFARAMESMRAPGTAVIPLVLLGEAERGLRGVPSDALLAAARAAGLDASTLRPKCLAHRRQASPDGAVAQLYYIIFEDEAFTKFRAHVASLAAGAGGGTLGVAAFEPAALSPVLFVASTDPSYARWLPLRADPAKECVAGLKAVP